MVRAPPQLRLTRNMPVSHGTPAPGARRATGLRRRDRDAAETPRRRPAGASRENVPRSRRGAATRQRDEGEEASEKLEDSLTDGMVAHLLRLQKKEWDRIPYEPMYYKDSPAIKDVVELGNTLFQGEEPRRKKAGRLEWTLGIQNMHGA